MKHTQGTWIKDGLNIYTENDLQGTPIASCSYVGKKITCEANARLIAAAPELLDALHFVRGAVDFKPEYTEHIRIIDEAITKAEK